jgi:hypothetical protein
MSRLTQLAVAAASAAIALAACGGGGSSPAPTAGAKAAGTPAPAAASRAVVGRANVNLVLPHVVSGKSGMALRALPAKTARNPQYINPSPAPSGNVYAGNVLNIYVDGSLIPNIDGSDPDLQHSLVLVNPAADGTQAVNLPLFSSTNNSVVVIEYDMNGSNLLAIGDNEVGGISVGQSLNISLTMQMNAVSIGIIDVAQTAPALMQGGQYDAFACPNVGQRFGLFTADAEGVFVPVVGYGGTNAPTATVNHQGATSTFTADTSGQYQIIWDGSCDQFGVNATVANPAYSIYNDAINVNFGGYQNGFFNNFSSGPNQGIFNLYYGSGFNIFQLNVPTINGSININGLGL